MPDFAEFQPHEHSSHRPDSPHQVNIRASTPEDAQGLAAVLAVRGGTFSDQLVNARRLMEQLPVLLVATSRSGELVGWSGARRSALHHSATLEWLIAGLTVPPNQRRKGIGRALLREAIGAIHRTSPEDPIHSVINVLNLASIELHRRIGFQEIARGETFAGIVFAGGEGMLMQYAEPQQQIIPNSAM